MNFKERTFLNNYREIQEAVAAGERALDSLRAVEKSLNSAGGWGLFDMFGGGMFSTMIKQSKINDARGELEAARYALRSFEKELQDVSRAVDLRIDIGSFLSFADFFFDNFFVDWMVQSKIDQAKSQVSQAIRQVEGILTELRRM